MKGVYYCMGLVTASSVKFDLKTSARVIGYYIYDIMDNDVADIRDLLVDERTHEPRYAVIEIGGLMGISGKKVLIPWGALTKGGISRMDIYCPAEQIMAAPSCLKPMAPTRAEEESIHSFFNVNPYWLTEREGEDEITDKANPPPPAPADNGDIADLEIEKNGEK